MMSKEFCDKQFSQKDQINHFQQSRLNLFNLMASTAGKQNRRKDFFLDQKACIYQSIIAVKYQLNSHCFLDSIYPEAQLLTYWIERFIHSVI